MPRKGYRKPQHEARTQRVHTSLTPSEKQHLDTCVAASDVIGRSDYLRLLIMAMDVPRRPSPVKAQLIDEVARLNRHLGSIDNNINQIARTRNSGLPVSEIHFERTLRDHRELKELARRVLAQLVAGR